MVHDLFADYVAVLIAAILGVALVAGALIGNAILAPREHSRIKSLTY